jgi:ABC-2 type transport system ATP-binding protein
MYKKLALSCALLHEPDLLVLDEPTNGVDPVSRIELWDLLHEFVAGGMAVVVSTPYMDEAERCRRVGLVHSGRLLLEGSPAALLGGLHQVVLHVAAAPAEADHLLAERAADLVVVAPQGDGLRVVVRAAAAASLEAALAAAGAPAERVRPTFEDLFLATVDAASQGAP